MKYFYCRKCDSFMDEREALCFIPEVHNELPEKPTEWISEERCIYCNNDELEDVACCEECGEMVPESELDDGLCRDCREEEG